MSRDNHCLGTISDTHWQPKVSLCGNDVPHKDEFYEIQGVRIEQMNLDNGRFYHRRRTGFSKRHRRSMTMRHEKERMRHQVRVLALTNCFLGICTESWEVDEAWVIFLSTWQKALGVWEFVILVFSG